MRRILFVIIASLICQNAFAVELLVFNKAHWMDSLSPQQVTARKESKAQGWASWRDKIVNANQAQFNAAMANLVIPGYPDATFARQTAYIAKKQELTDMPAEAIEAAMQDARVAWQEKYSGRYARGDIVEVRPDGFWTGPNKRGFDKSVFALIHIPGETLASSKHLSKAKETKSKFRRKFQVDMTQFVLDSTKVKTFDTLVKAKIKDKSK